MFVITFDEDDSNTKKNHVYTALIGPDWKNAPKKKQDKNQYDHYSLLRTIEDNVSFSIFLFLKYVTFSAIFFSLL